METATALLDGLLRPRSAEELAAAAVSATASAVLSVGCRDGCADSPFVPAAPPSTKVPSLVPEAVTAVINEVGPLVDAAVPWFKAQWVEASTKLVATTTTLATTLAEIDYAAHAAELEVAVRARMTPEVVAGLWVFGFFFFCYALFYRTVARRPLVYSQHLGRAHATQLPPPGITIDTSRGPLRAVADSVQGGALREALSSTFTPLPWLTVPFLSGHLQTIFTSMAPAWLLGTPRLTYRRELLRVEAGSAFHQAGQVALDWAVLGQSRRASSDAAPEEFHLDFTESTPTVIICHGLAGGSSEHYVKSLCFRLSSERGYRCVVFNARGCGGSEVVTSQLYCGAYTDDLRQVTAAIRSRLPSAPLLAVGFSLGANILTKFVGEEGLAGRPAPFTGVVALANPFDFVLGSRYLERSWLMRTVYSANLARSLVALFRKHVDALERVRQADAPLDESVPHATAPMDTYNLESVFSAPTLGEFDKRLTRIAFGYATVDDYYRDAGSARFVKFIHSPTLLISSLDDPISPRVAIPYDESSINPYVTLVTTSVGGHSMDWHQGLLRPRSWSSGIIQAFFDDILAGHARERQADINDNLPVVTPPTPRSARAFVLDQTSEQEYFAEEPTSYVPPSVSISDAVAEEEEEYTLTWSSLSGNDGSVEALDSDSSSSSTSSSSGSAAVAPLLPPASPSALLAESVASAVELDARIDEIAEEIQRRRQMLEEEMDEAAAAAAVVAVPVEAEVEVEEEEVEQAVVATSSQSAADQPTDASQLPPPESDASAELAPVQ